MRGRGYLGALIRLDADPCFPTDTDLLERLICHGRPEEFEPFFAVGGNFCEPTGFFIRIFFDGKSIPDSERL